MELNRRVRALERLRQPISDMDLADIRAARLEPLPLPTGLGWASATAMRWLFGAPRPGVAIDDDLVVPGPAGVLPVRRFVPAEQADRAPLVVHLHGGGWVLGSNRQYDYLCTALAEDLGAVVASVEYRLAPENRAPAAVEDAIAATRWLAANRDATGARGPVVVVGDSAGGNLAALVAIAARDSRDFDVAAQVLIYPGVDLACTSPSVNAMTDEPILPRRDIDAFLDHYLGSAEDSLEPTDPRISPIYVEDLSGVAPALVQVAEHDPLVDDGRRYADRLRRAGVPVQVTEYVGQVHGFVSLPGVSPLADQAVGEIGQWLARSLDDPGPPLLTGSSQESADSVPAVAAG